MLDENSKEDMQIKAGFLIAKKELEIKTGKVDGKSNEKKSNQEDILKKIKDSKKQKKTMMSGDLFVLRRSYCYTPEVSPEEVLEVVKEKLWDAPKDISLINICGVANMMIGDYHKADFEFKKAVNIDKGNKDVIYNLAELAMRKGNINDALAHISILLKKDREDLDAIYLMSMMLYLKNSYEQSAATIAQALKVDKLPYRSHKFFAVLYFLTKNFEKGEDEIRTVIEKDVSNTAARLAYQHLMLYNNNVMTAESEFRILKNTPIENVYQPCKLVNEAIYHYKTGTEDIADDLLTQAWQKNNKCLCSMVERARMLFDKEEYEECYIKLKKAAHLAPSSLLILCELLRAAYYVNVRGSMNLVPEMDDVIVKIFQIRKDVTVRIYNKNATIKKFELAGIKDNYFKNMQLIMAKYKEEDPFICIECEEEMIILKMMRNIKLCEMKCIDEK